MAVRKDAILKFGHDLTGGQFQRVRNLIDQQLAGFRNGRGWMILGHEVDIEFLNMTPAELDFTQSRETSAKEIMRIFAVPPPILGDMDQSTYNNMEEATKAFLALYCCYPFE
jgi:phage portal protein BeeE